MDKKQELVNSGVVFQAISSTLLKAKLPSINYEVVKEDRNITSVVHGGQSICLGDHYVCNTTTAGDGLDINYVVNMITVNSEDARVVNLFESIYNNTTIFCLPLVFPDKAESGYIIGSNGYLINSYVSCDFEDSKSRYSIFVLLKYLPSNRYRNQEKIYTENKHFIRTIDVSDHHVLYEFTIPEEFHKDYDILLDGKYSKLSKKAANQILSFHGKDIEGAMIYSAITKDPKFRQFIADDYNVGIEDVGELYKAFDYNDVLTKSML